MMNLLPLRASFPWLAAFSADPSFAAAERWLQENGLVFARNLLIALLLVAAGRIGGRWVRSAFIRLGSAQRLDGTSARYIGNIASVLIQTLAVVTALGQLGLPSTQFVAIIGAAGLAIGLALQGNLANFAAGFLIVFFRPFQRGDLVGAVGVEGVVDEIQAFSTVLVAADGRTIIVPNASLTSNPLTNHTARGRRSLSLKFPVPRGADTAALRRRLGADLATLEGVLSDPGPSLEIREIAGDRLTLELTVWVAPVHFATAAGRVAERLTATLDEPATAPTAQV